MNDDNTFYVFYCNLNYLYVLHFNTRAICAYFSCWLVYMHEKDRASKETNSRFKYENVLPNALLAQRTQQTHTDL